MASKNAITSIGLKVSIAVEATAGTRPVTNYYPIPGVTGLPDLDFEADTIETTSFDNLEYKSYLTGLKDTGGILSFEANFTDYGVEMWDDIVDQLKPSVNTTGKIAWLMIDIAGTTNKYFVPINPVATGLPTTDVNDKISINYSFTVVKDIVKDTVSSTATYYASGDYVPQ